MKKLRFLPLLLLMLLCLSVPALAASIPGQQRITSITDVNGAVITLTDDDTTTAWTKSASYGPDLTIDMYWATVGEIWIRNGYAYTQNWYNSYDRPSKIKVTVYYDANQYTTSYDTYRYTLTDAFRPSTRSSSWNSGYQRLLLPKQYQNVSRIELTIEEVIGGYNRTGATISDIIVASGSHATATPRSYSTATPRPYVVYITPSPAPGSGDDDPLVIPITPRPTATDEPLIYPITPRPTATDEPLIYPITPRPTATNTPLIYPITPRPTVPATQPPAENPDRDGVIGYANQSLPTRSGPSTSYDEPGTYLSSGAQVTVTARAWDADNYVWWYQFEFEYRGERYRMYTTGYRIDVSDEDAIPLEPQLGDPLDTRKALGEHEVYFGPGEDYARVPYTQLYAGSRCDIYAIENDWALVDYYDYAMNSKRRAWVPLNVLYEN